jgi:hypothetical protein
VTPQMLGCENLLHTTQAAPAGGAQARRPRRRGPGRTGARIPQPAAARPRRAHHAPAFQRHGGEERWGVVDRPRTFARRAREPCTQTRTGRSPLPGRRASTRPVRRRGPEKSSLAQRAWFTNFEELFSSSTLDRGRSACSSVQRSPPVRRRPTGTTGQRRRRQPTMVPPARAVEEARDALAQGTDRARGPRRTGRADDRRAAAGPCRPATTGRAVQRTGHIGDRAGPARDRDHPRRGHGRGT